MCEICAPYVCFTVTLITDPVDPVNGSGVTGGGTIYTGSLNGGGNAGGGNYLPTCNPNIAPGTAVGTNQALPCGTTLTPVTVINPNSNLTLNSAAGKFVMSNADQAAYPRFTEMVKNIKSMVTNNPDIMAGLKIWTGLNESTILSHLDFNQGPLIKIQELTNALGTYERNNPNIILIDRSWVQGLEKANLNSTKKVTSFLLAVTLLHEYVHYGDFLSGVEFNGEEGEEFEKMVFGVRLNRNNVDNIYIQMYGQPK